MPNNYKRQDVSRYVIKALQGLGGSASRQTIKEEVVADDDNTITYDDAFERIKSKNGAFYIPFNFDFNFCLKNLNICGYIEDYRRGDDIVLTEEGRALDYNAYPSPDAKKQIEEYWEKKHKDYQARKKKSKNQSTSGADKGPEFDEIPDEEDLAEDWKAEILERIKEFSPKKFESFSRMLLSHMGIKFDREKGVKMSGDHGIDGYGYFESDEFRTSKVVVQCKRFSENPVSEPDIDKFKGVMMSFNADYGIFITTSYFTNQAKEKAVLGGNTVTLIDGQRLVELIEKYKLQITPVQTYKLNDYYYQKD